MLQSSDNLVKEIFKTGSAHRKKISHIFSQMFPSPTGVSLQGELLEGKKAEYYPAAVEFSSHSIKLLQFAKTSRGIEIAKIACVPLGQETKGVQEMRTLLQKVLREHQLKGEAVTSLPLSKIQTLSFVIPSMPEVEIEQAVVWKLKQNLPAGFNFANITFDYSISALDVPAGRELRVLAFIAARDLVLERIKIFAEMSLKLVAISPEPYAIYSALLWGDKIPFQETVVFLHLGASESSISIVRGWEIQFIRPLNFSGNALTEGVASSRQVDWLKAEALKKEGTLNLSSQLENLLVDIEHAFKTFAAQQMKSPLNRFDRLILTGGTAGLKNIDQFLHDRLEVPVDVLDPFNMAQLYLRQDLSPFLQQHAHRFSSLVGTAGRFVEW